MMAAGMQMAKNDVLNVKYLLNGMAYGVRVVVDFLEQNLEQKN